MSACSVPACQRPHKGFGLCQLHLARQRTGITLSAPLRGSEPTIDRIRRNVVVSSALCWEWQGGQVRGGYGRISIDRRTVMVHRATYEALVGEIPEGLQLDHLCRNRICCNPAHLEPVTCRENLRRGLTLNAANIAKTHCINGHPLSGDNLSNRKGAREYRACKMCARAHTAAYRDRLRSALPPVASVVYDHGTRARHRRGCRCNPCIAAYNAYQRDHRCLTAAGYMAAETRSS